MPAVAKLKTLMEAIADRNWELAHSISNEIANDEENRGNQKAARTLRGALNKSGANTSSSSTQMDTVGSGYPFGNEFMLSRALIRIPNPNSIDDVFLRKNTKDELQEIIQEWKYRDVLQKHEIQRRNRILLFGPPGCGKTMTALAIGRELDLPTYIVRFSSLIGSYLGQTAANLREIFSFATKTECLILVDELDVLGKQRGSQQDVGELDRIVVGLMQEMDLTKPAGFIVAASNLISHLDPALIRRFDLCIQFPKPTKLEIRTQLKNLGKKYSINISKDLEVKAEKSLDFASIERLIQDEVRRRILRSVKRNGR